MLTIRSRLHAAPLSLWLCLVLAAPVAVAQEDTASAAESGMPRKTRKKEAPVREPGAWSLQDVSVEVYAGPFDGWNVRRESGVMAVVEADATPTVHLGATRLQFPVSVDGRATFGAALNEARGRAGAEAMWRLGGHVRLTLEGDLGGALRPDWNDLYQPDPAATGEYLPTDRYSYFVWRIRGHLNWMAARGHHLRLHYRYASYDYVNDPNYDPAVSIVHLAPFDKAEHQIRLGYRYLWGQGWAAALRFEYVNRQDDYQYARTAGTGGAARSHGLQQFVDYEPNVELEIPLGGDAGMSLRYGYALRDDTYQGYYSYAGHHPRASLGWNAGESVYLAVSFEGLFRTFGPNSYAAGPTHPPLDDGTRRVDDKWQVDALVKVAVGGGFSVFGQGLYVQRRTNYPDYVPGVFPATRNYDIRWDYHNWRALAGVSFGP
jgi:hypothetical protein